MFRHLFKLCLVIPAVALALTALSPLSSAQTGLPVVICKGQPVPSGWVIVGETHSVSCPNPTDLTNAWIIRKLN